MPGPAAPPEQASSRASHPGTHAVSPHAPTLPGPTPIAPRSAIAVVEAKPVVIDTRVEPRATKPAEADVASSSAAPGAHAESSEKTTPVASPAPPAALAPPNDSGTKLASAADTPTLESVWAKVLAHLRPKSSIFVLVSKLQLTEITSARVCLRGGAAAVGMQASYMPALTDAFATVLARAVSVQILTVEVVPPANNAGTKPQVAPRTEARPASYAPAMPPANAPGTPTLNRGPNAEEIQAQAHPLVQKAVTLFAGRVSKTTLRKAGAASDAPPIAGEAGAPALDAPMAPGAFNPTLTPDDMIDD